MKTKLLKNLTIIVLTATSLSFARPAFAEIQCALSYTLESWSVFYKQGKGSGRVVCNNGEKYDVIIKSHGGGISFGKSKVSGRGNFTGVKTTDELFGSYAAAQAHAGVKKSGRAQVLTKGDVSLSLTGTGEGIDIGIAFGNFTITKSY